MKFKEIIQKIQEKRKAEIETRKNIETMMKFYNDTYDYMKYCCRNCHYFDEFYTKYHSFNNYLGYCDYWQDDHDYDDLCFKFVNYHVQSRR